MLTRIKSSLYVLYICSQNLDIDHILDFLKESVEQYIEQFSKCSRTFNVWTRGSFCAVFAHVMCLIDSCQSQCVW